MMKLHILMIKQHNKTGLKYFCYHFGTIETSEKYYGSGLIWKRHLKKHGSDVSSEIVAMDENHEVIKKIAIEKSIELDVVNSKKFANLILETADASGMHNDEIKIKAKKNQIIKMRERGGLSEKQKLQLDKLHQWLKGKSMKERCGDDWVNPLKGKSMKERCGDDWVNPLKGKRYTMKEKRGNDWVNPKKGKSIKEINGEKWIDPRLGKSMKEYRGNDWVNPKKGKNMKYYKGNDYISRGQIVRLIIDGEIIRDFASITECSNFLKINIATLSKIAKSDNAFVIKKRISTTKHCYPINTKIQIIKL